MTQPCYVELPTQYLSKSRAHFLYFALCLSKLPQELSIYIATIAVECTVRHFENGPPTKRKWEQPSPMRVLELRTRGYYFFVVAFLVCI
jgi:hypothetical protein